MFALQRMKSNLALDLGTATVALCQLRRRRSGFDLRRAVVLEDPLRERITQDKRHAQALTRATRVAQQCAVGGAAATFGLKPPDVSFHNVRMPDALFTASPAAQAAMLRSEAARQTQSQPDELQVDFWTLPPGNRTGNNVMLLACPLPVVANQARTAATLGLNLVRLDALPVALVRTGWQLGLPGAPHERPPQECLWGVVDIGFTGTTISVALGWQCVYVRSAAIGGDALSSAIENGLRVNYATAETLKKEYGPHTTPGQSGNAAEPHLKELAPTLERILRTRLRTIAEEIERAFGYAMESYPAAAPVGLYLSGGGARLADLPESLARLLGTVVEPLDVSRLVSAESQADKLAGCVGMALGDFA